ncbi:hypothetical protein BT96DRAFT_990848 [Gymnopus androsaceus JB14]|uniref:Uncharacterized protein n=1 Tax=Gymnopus androsaceus JB14 TaxID=1447944 RepID=A0A6A4I1R9_9AGAR|nr:hypothetical protein BT96DRAFT_990848 [Gymnopus androsaceus JB14]
MAFLSALVQAHTFFLVKSCSRHRTVTQPAALLSSFLAATMPCVYSEHTQDVYSKAGSFSAVGGNQSLTLEEPDIIVVMHILLAALHRVIKMPPLLSDLSRFSLL